MLWGRSHVERGNDCSMRANHRKLRNYRNIIHITKIITIYMRCIEKPGRATRRAEGSRGEIRMYI